MPGLDAGVHLSTGGDDLLGDLDQVGGHLLGLAPVRGPPPDHVLAAPHGQPAADREHRHARGRLLGAEETASQPALDEHLLQRPGRPSWRQAGAPQRLRHNAAGHGLGEPDRLSGYLPATEPGSGQVLAPPPGRQPGHHTEPAPAHRVGSGGAGLRRQVVLPATQRVEDLDGQFPPSRRPAQVDPQLGRARDGPGPGAVELDVGLRVEGVGGQFARHEQAVGFEFGRQAQRRGHLTEHAPRHRGTGRVGREGPGTAATASQRGGTHHRGTARAARRLHGCTGGRHHGNGRRR